MATKARVLKLAISKDDSIDVAIWKLMADRVGRTASEIADALVAYGHDRTNSTTRAKALMRRGWFNRDEKQGKAITKYILKGNIEMPKQENDKTQTEAGFMPTADELSNAPVIQNRNPSLNLEETLTQPLPEGKVEFNENTVSNADPINPKEGVLTCIWKITHDFQCYSKEDVVVLLTAAGIGESTAKQKFAEAILKGWFIAHTEQIDGKDVKVFKLQEHIEKPVDDKPYLPRGPYNKVKAPEVKGPDLVDQAQQPSEELQKVKAELSQRAEEAFGAPTGVLSSIPQGGAPAPDRSQGESEVRLPTYFQELTADDISEIEVALFTWVATWPGDTEKGVLLGVAGQGYKLEDVEKAFEQHKKYFINETFPDSDVKRYKLPYVMTRQTATKERVAQHINEFHRNKREEILDRVTNPTTNKEDSNMAKSQNEAAQAQAAAKPLTKAQLAAITKINDATVVLWNLVKNHRGASLNPLKEDFAKAVKSAKLRDEVWAANEKFFEIAMLAEVNYIKGPFGAEHPELTLADIEQYKVNAAKPKSEDADAIAPIDQAVVESITPYDGILRATILLLKDGKKHRLDEVESALRSKGFNGVEMRMVQDHLIKLKELVEAGSVDGVSIVQFVSDRKVPEPRFVIHQENGISFDPLNGMDYNLYLLLKDGRPRYMSEIVEVLTKTGFTQARIQDRLLQATGFQYNFLEMDNGENGMQFRYMAGGVEVEPKQVVQPDSTIESLRPSHGLLHNVYRILSKKGVANFEAMVHRLSTTGFDRVILKPLLDDMVARKVLILETSQGYYKLLPGAVEPKITTDITQLERKMGMDLCLYKLLDDGNWTTAEFMVEVLARIGFDKERAKDAVAKHSDKGGMLTVGVIGDHTVIRLSDDAKEPAVEAVEEERRGATAEDAAATETAAPAAAATPTPAPSGLHAYESTSGNPESKAAPVQPLLSIDIRVAGQQMSIGGLIQLYLELGNMGFGHPGYMPQRMRQSILQSQHSINGRIMSEGDLQQIAMALNGQIPPGPWLSQKEQQQSKEFTGWGQPQGGGSKGY